MASNTWGLPDAVLTEWTKRQKLDATTAEKATREKAKATNKATAPTTGGADLPWWSPAGIAQRVTGLGFGAKKTPEEQKKDPRTPLEQMWDAIVEGASGAGDIVKWVVVGLVAIAAIVVVPRFLGRR